MTDFSPAAPEPVDPDSAIADLEADFQATTAPPEVIVVQDEPPPIGRSWAFDFTQEQFLTNVRSHAPLETRDIATLILWAEKCLRTARGAHPIHPPGYGLQDPHGLIGQVITGAPVADLEARIRDALTFHPRIVDIQDFEYGFDPTDEWIAVSFTVVLDNDNLIPMNTSLSLTTTTEF